MPTSLRSDRIPFHSSRADDRAIIMFASAAATGLAGLSLLALLAWSLVAPPPYPLAARSGLRPPAAHFDVRGDCVQWTIIDKAYYTAPQDQAHIIRWLKQAGWMENFRYDDSVLKQASRQYAFVHVARVREIFVEARAGGAGLVATTQTTLSFGSC